MKGRRKELGQLLFSLLLRHLLGDAFYLHFFLLGYISILSHDLRKHVRNGRLLMVLHLTNVDARIEKGITRDDLLLLLLLGRLLTDNVAATTLHYAKLRLLHVLLKFEFLRTPILL